MIFLTKNPNLKTKKKLGGDGEGEGRGLESVIFFTKGGGGWVNFFLQRIQV